MSVRKHGQGWQIRFQHRGTLIARTVRGTQAEAIQAERAMRTRIERGAPHLEHRRTIGDALTHWLTGAAQALHSYDDARAKARHWLPWEARLAIDAPAVAAEATKSWLERGLAVATINRRLAALRRALNIAHREGWLSEPVGLRIKALSGERVRYVQATQAQVRDLIAACKSARVRDAITLAVHTGLRQGEMLRLDPARHYHPAGAANEPASLILDAENKTGRPRVIPLTAEADAIARTLPLDISYPHLRREFEHARAAIGMPWLQWRDLRRTFGSWIVQRTGSLKAAQDLLGHTTSTITAKHYAHLLAHHLASAIEALPVLSRGKKTGQKNWPRNHKAAPIKRRKAA